jgi:hypothetical protein
MSDKFRKTHPWRCTVLRSIKTTVMGHVIEQTPGERMGRTKKQMVDFRAAIIAENGIDSVSEVQKAL